MMAPDESGQARVGVVPITHAPPTDPDGGTQLLSRDAGGSFHDFRPAIEQRGFRLLHSAPKYRDESLLPFGINAFYYPFERHASSTTGTLPA